MTGTLLTVRNALVSGLTSKLPGVHVSYHGGEMTLEDIRRYAKQLPAVVVALQRFTVDMEAGSYAAIAHWTAVCIARNTPGVLRADGIIELADATARALMLNFIGYSAGETASAPKSLVGTNEYTATLDKMDLAFWSFSWQQSLDLRDPDFSPDDLVTVDVLYDLAPRPSGEALGDAPEAEDTLTDLDT